MLTFRWNVWGETPFLMEMLTRSMESFRRYVHGSFDARYIVVCENPDIVYEHCESKIDGLYKNTSGIFSVPKDCGSSHLRKYCPSINISGGTEIYIDTDIFCIQEPTELFRFVQDDNYLAVIQARMGAPGETGYGVMLKEIDPSLPACCDGLIGFKPEYDIFPKFLDIINRVTMEHTDFHWIQAAAVKSMEPEMLQGRVLFLTDLGMQYCHPRVYPIDYDNPNTQILHCICGGSPPGKPEQQYLAYKELIKRGMI